MPQVTIYTTPICPYCVRAKQLFKHKGVAYEEVDVAFDSQRRAEMIERAHGQRSVPQIFIGDTHVGGCDDLYELEHEGKLAPLLAQASEPARA
jgi:glutaredoxin 3